MQDISRVDIAAQEDIVEVGYISESDMIGYGTMDEPVAVEVQEGDMLLDIVDEESSTPLETMNAVTDVPSSDAVDKSGQDGTG